MSFGAGDDGGRAGRGDGGRHCRDHPGGSDTRARRHAPGAGIGGVSEVVKADATHASAGKPDTSSAGPSHGRPQRSQLPRREMDRPLEAHGRRGPLDHRLLHDDTIRTEGRLTALLLLQWPSAISLTVGHVEEAGGGSASASATKFRSTRASRRPGPSAGRRPPQPRGPRPHGLVVALPRRPAQPPDQRLGYGRTAPQAGIRLARNPARPLCSSSPPSCPPHLQQRQHVEAISKAFNEATVKG